MSNNKKSINTFIRIIDYYKYDLIKSVQKLVRIRSVQGTPELEAPFGQGPADALNSALEIANNLGFKTVNMEGYIGYAEYGKSDDYIAVLGHLDVVPEGEGWKHPPYGAEIHEGKIFGRGTVDDKGPTVAALYALKAVEDSKVPLRKKIRVIFGVNEETENADIKYYMQREPLPSAGFTPDGFYPLVYAEKGIMEFDLIKKIRPKVSDYFIKSVEGGKAPNIVPDFAKAEIYAEDPNSISRSCRIFAEKTGYELTTETKEKCVIIKSRGVTAHGSVPEDGKNAITRLLAFLSELPLGGSEMAEAINFINNKIGTETSGRSLNLALRDELSGSLSLNVGKIKINEFEISVTLDLRYPVSFTDEDVLSALKSCIFPSGFHIKNLINQSPLYYPLNAPLVKTLLNVYKKITGSDEQPIAIGMGTYAKEMPNILAFGPTFPGDPIVEHKPNEYVTIDNLILNSKIFAQAIYELAL